jgi:hypothetical protein
VDATDVLIAQQLLVGVPPGVSFDPTRCDVHPDGISCGVADISQMQRFLLGDVSALQMNCTAYNP